LILSAKLQVVSFKSQKAQSFSSLTYNFNSQKRRVEEKEHHQKPESSVEKEER
jgi:hypothetical protein